MTNVKNLSILLLTSLLLGGCSSLSWNSVKPIEVKTVAVEKTPLNLKESPPVQPKNIKWFVITPENAEEVFQELKDKKYDVVLYGLTDDGYEDLSMNLAKLRKYIIEERAIIKAYKEYYEPVKKAE